MTELTRTASEMFVNTARFLDAYHAVMQPLCTEAKLPPAALDIILYLANNPSYNTAKDICRHKGLKPSIVSFHVDRLVTDGYLERREVPGDRRKPALVCTAKAAPLIARGRELQHAFAVELGRGLAPEDLEHFRRCVAVFDRNIDRLRGSVPRAARSEEAE